MADNFQDKTEQPTPKRLHEAKQKGNVAKSVEVNSAVSLLGGLALIYLTSGMFFRQFTLIFQGILSGGYHASLSTENLLSYFVKGLAGVGVPAFLLMGGLLLIGLAASYLQVGFIFTWEPIQPKFEKINPGKGFKKIIFSKRSLEELAKNFLKLGIVLYIAWDAVSDYKDEFIPLMDKTVPQIFHFMLTVALKISLKIAAVFLFIAAADYAFQRYEYIRNLRMTKQEIKEENKQMEGDPTVKSRIRSQQFKMARQRMMQEIPTADVVITNPTHFAVALKYETDKMAAPRVIAKGKDRIALKIKEIAREHQIPLVEDPPLARALFKAVEINQEIPGKFFQAVAEVLAYVYKLKKNKF